MCSNVSRRSSETGPMRLLNALAAQPVNCSTEGSGPVDWPVQQRIMQACDPNRMQEM